MPAAPSILERCVWRGSQLPTLPLAFGANIHTYPLFESAPSTMWQRLTSRYRMDLRGRSVCSNTVLCFCNVYFQKFCVRCNNIGYDVYCLPSLSAQRSDVCATQRILSYLPQHRQLIMTSRTSGSGNRSVGVMYL